MLSPKVADTATSTLLQEMFVLEHPETTVQQNRAKQREDRKKREEQKRVSRGEDCSVENGKTKSMISPRRLDGIDEKRESERVEE
jgi:hypothetical protein